MKVFYNTSQLVEGSGLPKRTAQNLIAKGVLRPSSRAQGSGTNNRFELCEIEIASILNRLMPMALGAKTLEDIAQAIRPILCSEGSIFANNPELNAKLAEWVRGGGPELDMLGGGGAGQPATQRENTVLTNLTESDWTVFLCRVAFEMAKLGDKCGDWEIQFSDNGVAIHPVFLTKQRQKGWRYTATRGSERALAILIPLGGDDD